jgi:hypothetical protein
LAADSQIEQGAIDLNRPGGSVNRLYPTGQFNHFVLGKPAAFQALRPPAMERTFLWIPVR